MSTETGFNKDWLEQRYVFDNRARNVEVEIACLTFFKNKKTLNIIDLGSGSGSSCLYLMEKFTQDQHWTFVELNPQLASVSLDRITREAQQKGWPVNRRQENLTLELPGRQVSIKVINASFLELEKFIDLTTVDLATAAAVFDLLSMDMLHQVLGLLYDHNIAVLATINYAGMDFQPKFFNDNYYITFYESHMQRPQHFGNSLGPYCSSEMLVFYYGHQVNAVSGASNWQVGPEDKIMHGFLLDYMEVAIPEMLETDDEVDRFKAWMEHKRTMVDNGELITQVFHFDIFAPGG